MDEKEKKIHELEETIKVLEAENEALSERTEDISLLSHISSQIISISDAHQIIDEVLEQLSIYKNIYYSALGKWKANYVLIQQEYCLVTNEKILEFIEIFDERAKEIKETKKFIGKTETLFSDVQYLSIPFQMMDKKVILITESIFTMENVFVFVFNNDIEYDLNDLEFILQQAIHLVSLRIENLNLIAQLKEESQKLSYTLSEESNYLKEATKNFRQLTDHSPDGIILHDNGTIKYVNEAVCELLGYIKEDMIGKSVFSYLKSSDKKSVKHRIEKTQSGQAQGFREYQMRTSSGSYVWVEASGIPIYEGGRVLNYVTIRDIAERKLIEKELRKQKSFYSRIMDSITNPLLVINPKDYSIIHANKASGITSLYPKKYCHHFLHNSPIPCKQAGRECPLETLKETGKPSKATHKHIMPDGSLRIYEIQAFPILDDNGELEQVIEYSIDITDRIETESELIKLKKGIEQLDEIVFITDNNGDITYVNPAFEKIYGFTAEEVIGENPRILKSGQLSETFYKDFWERLLTKGSIRGTISNRTKHGKILYIDSTVSSITNEDGEITGFIAVQRDVTEKIQKEKELQEKEQQIKENEKRFKALFEEAGEGIFLIDSKRKIIDLNKSALMLTGYTEDETKGKDFSMFFSGEELERHPLMHDEILNGKSITLERNLKKKNGETIPIELSGKLIADNIIEVFIRDLSDKKEKERILKANEERLRNIISLSPIGILVLQKGKIQYTNKTLVETLGYDRYSDLVGKPILDFVAEDYKEIAQQRLRKLMTEGGKVAGLDEKFVRKDGSLVDVYVIGQQIEYEGQPAIQGYIYDITERVNYERQLKFEKERAEAADRLKSEFLAQISHEIRTPLNSIVNNNFIIREGIPSEYQNMLQNEFTYVNEATDRLIRTVELLIETKEATLGAYTPQMVKLDLSKEVLDSIYSTWYITANKKNLDFELINNAASTEIIGDFNSIKEIYSQIIDNAIKFTDEGKVKILVTDTKEKITVKVSDTGIGIDEDNLSNIFKPFWQEHQGYARHYEGNGLGMYLAKKYCELNKIELLIESKKGEGTTVTTIFKKNAS